MKTITKNASIATSNVTFGTLVDGSITFHTLRIHIEVCNSIDYKLNGDIRLEDWIYSMLHGKIIVPVGMDIGFLEYLSILRVENVEIGYILSTLLAILEKLNTDKSVTFNSLHYETV